MFFINNGLREIVIPNLFRNLCIIEPDPPQAGRLTYFSEILELTRLNTCYQIILFCSTVYMEFVICHLKNFTKIEQFRL